MPRRGNKAMYSVACLIISVGLVNSNVIINRFEDDNCSLAPALVNEIESYRNVTGRIIDVIKNGGLGKQMYAAYTDFIDTFGARVSGSEVLENAIDHMIQLTKSNGVTDVTTEELPVPHWVRGHEYARMIEPRKKKIAILGLGSSVSTPPEGITAEAVVVQSFNELAKLDTEKVRGKIVVYDVPFVSYGDTVAYRAAGATKASMKGAVASLVRSITPFSLYSLHTGAQYYGSNVTKIPSAAITHEDADLLKRLQDKGKKIILHINMKSTFDMKTSRNTIIDVKGETNPEKTVIVSGHIDSWDVGQGAMDDGGGMFISWFAPIVINHLNLKPKRTLRAILWTAEEPGLVGAFAYLKRHKNELPNINFIMESDEGTFKPLGVEIAGSKRAKCIVKEVMKQFAPISLVKESDGPGSDISIFIKEGVPGASLLNNNSQYFWYHHSDGDTLNVQNIDDVIDCAAFYTAFAYVLADLSQDLPRD